MHSLRVAFSFFRAVTETLSLLSSRSRTASRSELVILRLRQRESDAVFCSGSRLSPVRDV